MQKALMNCKAKQPLNQSRRFCRLAVKRMPAMDLALVLRELPASGLHPLISNRRNSLLVRRRGTACAKKHGRRLRTVGHSRRFSSKMATFSYDIRMTNQLQYILTNLKAYLSLRQIRLIRRTNFRSLSSESCKLFKGTIRVVNFASTYQKWNRRLVR